MASGIVKSWGSGSTGQLGDGGVTNTSNVPIDATVLSNIAAIYPEAERSCARTTGGSAICWGYGYLGDSVFHNVGDEAMTPVNVTGLTSGVAALASGDQHTCALTSGGGVKCWGDGTYGALGDGTNVQHYDPVDVVGLTSGVIAISSGFRFSCALTSGGGVKCWGNNFYGQLGDGTTGFGSNVPVDVVGLGSGVTGITVGGSTACALTSGGGVKCWGSNGGYGQLGDGTFVDSSVPVDVTGLSSGVTAIATGSCFSCVLMDTGAVKCWGDGMYGQLTIDTSTPKDVIGF